MVTVEKVIHETAAEDKEGKVQADLETVCKGFPESEIEVGYFHIEVDRPLCRLPDHEDARL